MSMTENERNIWTDTYRFMNENVGEGVIDAIKTEADAEAFWSKVVDNAAILYTKHNQSELVMSLLVAIIDEIERRFDKAAPRVEIEIQRAP